MQAVCANRFHYVTESRHGRRVTIRYVIYTGLHLDVDLKRKLWKTLQFDDSLMDQ